MQRGHMARYLDLSCSEAKIHGVVPKVNQLGRERVGHKVIKRQNLREWVMHCGLQMGGGDDG